MRGRSPHLPLLLLFLLSFLTLPVDGATTSGFRICAFNAQKFNFAKASNPTMRHTMTRILSRYDICLLQEVMDPDGKAIQALLASLNRPTDRYSGFYQHVEHPLININHLSHLYLHSLLILMPVILGNTLFLDSQC
ncbi:deoxyribonuclease-1-like 1 [Plectropomus leopardus]|uniref:deoxyribonuclease-1-like 1 n=1 Tax=Plectropomus leopardus TaxID=160734 RepID=UPI001C4CF5EB|nr:deoxyribonuclease-1-like 1 [Plectropomus leopardus]